MPRIRLRTNLGTADARRLGLLGNSEDGCVADVSPDAAAWLLARRYAVPLDDEPPSPPAPAPGDRIHAVPAIDVQADQAGGDDEEHATPSPRPRHRKR